MSLVPYQYILWGFRLPVWRGDKAMIYIEFGSCGHSSIGIEGMFMGCRPYSRSD
mgnify:CR=1 FL=1